MANINLDIKANTQKALGEFKKLSRELDNKFLVQGLKLDVVKSAFRDIERQFQNSLGESGLKAAENTAQLKRALALNFVTFKRFNNDVAGEVSRSIRSSLSGLAAQGKITQDTLKETLNFATFFDFEGTEEQRKKAFVNFASDFAQLNQNLRRAYGQGAGQLVNRVLTGQFGQDELFQLEQGLGGAVGNRLRQLLRERPELAAGLQSSSGVVRSRVANELRRTLENSPEYKEAVAEVRRTQPLTILRDEIAGLFDPNQGVFGSLREVAGTGTNILTETAKLLRSIFDPKEGLFAKVAQLLGQALGISDPLEPIIRAVQFITQTIEGLTKGTGNIESFITSIFDALRGLFDRVKQFIDNIDADQLGSVIKTVVDEILKTLPSLLGVLFSAIGKSLEVAFSNQTTGIIATVIGALGLGKAGGLINRLLGGDGLRAGILNSIRTRLGGRDEVTGERLSGFQGEARRFQINVVRYLDLILRQLGGGTPFGPAEPPGRGPRRPRGTPGRDGRTSRQRLRDMRRLRSGGGFGSRIRNIPRGIGNRLGAFNLLRGVSGGVPGISSFSNPQGASVGRLLTDYRSNRSIFDINNRVRGLSPATRPGFTAEGIGFRAPQIPRPIPRITPPAAGGGLLSRLGGATRGLRGGLRRIPLLGTALSGLALASIIGAPGAQADELEGLTPEEKKEQRREERREKTRGVLGVVGGIAGGAAGGAALGTVIGGPVGTLIGGIIGGIVGEVAVKLLSDPIIDGIGNFAAGIGDWFSNLWRGTKDLFGSAGEGIANFFGERGPIQSIWRFLMDIPNKVQEFVSSGWDFLSGALKDVPKSLLLGVFGPLGMGAGFIIDKLQGRALGGSGRGLTLVGENGPEFVDFGTGSVAYPSSSFSGMGSRGRSSSGPISIVINVNAPGANEFANQLTDQVIDELNRQFELNEENI